MKKISVLFLILSLAFSLCTQVYANNQTKNKAETEAARDSSLVKSAILMEA